MFSFPCGGLVAATTYSFPPHPCPVIPSEAKQQRLTALYLGLRGSYAYKEGRKRWDNPQAFPIRRLYLNLLSPSNDEQRDLLYCFYFLTSDEAKEMDDETYWFKAGDILDLKSQFEVNNFLIGHGLMTRPQDKAKFANETLFKFWSVIHETRIINYFLEKDESLDKVLNIFIRVNSGGTFLSYSDLLLSVATAQWKERDAREEITGFVDELNSIGDGFGIDKDFVLKSCLVLADFPDIGFRVDNFNKANMLHIEKEWDRIAAALRNAVTLVSSFGYTRDTLTANYPIIPIAYHLLRMGLPSNFDQAATFADGRNKIKHWLMLSLLKRAFGGVPDAVLRPIREILRSNNGEFPLQEIRERFKGTTKSLDFTDDEIENLLLTPYGKAYTFSTLVLLYPWVDLRNKFHIDHIFPRSKFTRKGLSSSAVPDFKIDSFIKQADLLPNLQLMEGIPNQEKNDSYFGTWLDKRFTAGNVRSDYMAKNYIPNCGLTLTDFGDFFRQRQQLLREELYRLLKPI